MVKRNQSNRSKTSQVKKSRENDELNVALAEGRYQYVVDVLGSRLRTGKRSPNTLYLLGMAWIGLNDLGRAAKYFEESIACGGDPTEALQQLARAYFQLDRFADSAIVLQKLVETTADRVEYWRNLVLALECDSQIDLGLRECLKAVALFPTDASLYRQLGDLFKAKEDWQKAAEAYHRCVELEEGREDARKLHVAMLRRLGDREAILEALERWIRISPNNPVAEHLRGAYLENLTPARASDDYVREVFDQFADTFDSQLTALQYQAPRQLANHILRLPLEKNRSLYVLDAGCGTGLLGEWLRPYASKLLGVDLSSQMLARAEKLTLYDELKEAELTAYLVEKQDAFDLIASADTLNYFGDLRPFCLAAHNALRARSGWLAFTLESRSHSDDSISDLEQAEYSLQPSGRYTHAIDRVVEILKECGFIEMDVAPCVLRQEAGKDVSGVVISCRSQR